MEPSTSNQTIRALPKPNNLAPLQQWLPVLNYTTFASCNSISQLEESYRVKQITFASEDELIAQIQSDWSKAQVSAAQYYIELGEGVLEPTVIENASRSRSIFGLRHCIDPQVPDFTDKLEDHVVSIASGPVYVEHNIGENLKLTLPHTECADWIVMTTAERFCYGVAMGSAKLFKRKRQNQIDHYSSKLATTVFDLSKIALEHLCEPSALRLINYKGEAVSLFEKLTEHQGVFSPLLFGSSPFGVLPEYVDLELKLKRNVPLSVNERRSLFSSLFLAAVPYVHANGIFGAAHSAQVSYFQRNPPPSSGYNLTQSLARECAALSLKDPSRYKLLCDEQRAETLQLVAAGQVLIEKIEQGSFNDEVDGEIFRRVEAEVRSGKEDRDLEIRLDKYFR
jgi:hypothetical protein